MDLVSKVQYFVTVIIGDGSECKHTDAFICGAKLCISPAMLFLQSKSKRKKCIGKNNVLKQQEISRRCFNAKKTCFYIILEMNRFSLLNGQRCWQKWLTSLKRSHFLYIFSWKKDNNNNNKKTGVYEFTFRNGKYWITKNQYVPIRTQTDRNKTDISGRNTLSQLHWLYHSCKHTVQTGLNCKHMMGWI